jgi:hypothetical protein
MKFQLALSAQQETAFHTQKLLEIVLQRVGLQFELAFQFGPAAAAVPEAVRALREAAAEDAADAAAETATETATEAATEAATETAAEAAWAGAVSARPAPALMFPEYLKVEDPA